MHTQILHHLTQKVGFQNFAHLLTSSIQLQNGTPS